MSDGFEYMLRPADPLHRREYPGATEIVLLLFRKPQRILGVFETYEVAESICANLNSHAEAQIR